MRAAVLRAPGILELESLPDPELPKGGALLEIKACAVCGTDIKMRYQGHRDLVYPAVLGHEMVGRILELDGAGSSLAEGDLVQIWPGIACGRCRQCLRGQDNLCQEIKIMGFNTQGGFADLMALPAECLSRSINPIPEDTDCDLLTLTEPLACCCNGQIKASVRRGDCILILGGGPIGALHALLAQIHGAERIIIAEKLPSRICLLKKHTNSVVFDPRIEEPKDVVAAETDGQGADVILSATPEIPLDCDILSLLSPGGRACVFSGPSPGHHQKTIDMRLIHNKESAVVGSYGCTSSQFRSAADLLTSGRVRADWLITKRSSLAKIDEAFAHCALRLGMKSIVCA
ncbi:MAG: alcohol dehydrogenase catalytic domain-containing protein [Methanothrix sp.]|nr:alcohol dehydrogenase catalytic domain-containing protein [Methanothrix sp.]